MMYYWNGAGGCSWGGGGLFEVLWWILIVWIVIAVVRAVRRGAHWHVALTPLEILKERYAKGELAKDEFETMKKDLEG